MKKTAIIVILTLLLNCIGFVGVTRAEAISVSSDAETRLEGESYTSADSGVGAFFLSSGRTIGPFNMTNWFSYDIEVSESGSYAVFVALSSPAVNTISVQVGGENKISNAAVDSTGGWNNFEELKLGEINLLSGKTTIKFLSHGLGAYLDYFLLEKIEIDDGSIPITDEASVKLEGENFAEADENRSAFFQSGGKMVGAFNQGNYLSYKLNVKDAGRYVVLATLASPSTNKISVFAGDEELITSAYVTSTGSWSNFIPSRLGICELPAGKITIKFLSHGLGAYIDSFELRPISTENDTIIAADFSESENVMSVGSELLMSSGSWSKYDIKIINGGFYKLSVNAAVAGNVVMNVSQNGIPCDKINFVNTNGFGSYSENILYLKLDKGISTLKFRLEQGSAKISDFSLQVASGYTEENEKSFINEINNSKSADEIYSVLKEYEDIFLINTDDLSSGIFYKETLFESLVGKNFSKAEEIIKGFMEKAEKEKESPEVGLYSGNTKLTKLKNGDLSLKVKSDKLKPQMTVAFAIYEANKLHYMNMTQYSGSGECIIDLKGLSVNENTDYTFKLLYYEDFTNISPFDINDNVYKNIYVSANGDDSASGDKEHPFLTLKRAKEEIVQINDSMTGDVVVNILPGYYELSETEIFGEEHSGKNGHNVIIKGVDRANPPVFSGGERIDGWQKHTENIYKAPLSGVDEVRNLYINDIPAIRAKSEYVHMYVSEYDDSLTPYAVDGVEVLTEDFPYRFSEPESLELVWELNWECHRTPVADVVSQGDKTVLFMEQPCFGLRTGTTETEINPGRYFFIENAYELLDRPGEFYYSKKDGMIYYYPHEEEDLETADSYIAKTEFLFDVSGTDENNKVHNIVFDNLDIKYGAWNEVSNNGLIGIQADMILDTQGGTSKNFKLPAQFAVNFADNIIMRNCRFSCLGSSAVGFDDCVSNSRVEGNLIKDVSGSGIAIGSWDHINKSKNTCLSIDVSNNIIKRAAYEYRNCTGISVYYESGISITNNTISELPYSGMSIGWGWGSEDPTNCGNIKVSKNKITDVMNCLIDGSHIYTLGALRDSAISENYFEDSKYMLSGIYTDSGSAYLKIFDNVINESRQGSIWWYMGYYLTHDLHAFNNYTTIPDINQMGENNVAEGTIQIEEGSFPQTATAIMEASGVSDEYKHLLSGIDFPDYSVSHIKSSPVTPYCDNFTGRIIRAKDYVNCYKPAGYVSVVENYVVFNAPEWLEYDVTVEESGTYSIKTCTAMGWGKGYVARFGVSVNGNEQLYGEIKESESWSDYSVTDLGKIQLKKGTNRIRITNYSGGLHFNSFAVEVCG